tara:strand:+ start:53 stop:640 length:588 start_codon:yes stop_codon:yes gene_type:complete
MIVISGYGRSGSSLLVGILTHLGFNTGFSKEDVACALNLPARAGLEVSNANLYEKGRVVKKPGYFWVYRDQLSKSPNTLKEIEICIIPFRSISKSYKSRKHCTEILKSDTLGGLHRTDRKVPGGITEALLAELLGWDIDTCLMHDIPFVFLKYPDYSKDADYFYRQLKSILKPKNITASDVQKAFDEIEIKEPRV